MHRIIFADAVEGLKQLPDESVDTCVTSPPYYGLRDYGADGQIGLEKTPNEYIGRLIEVFREVKRVLKPDGTAWVNLGDCYAGTGSKGDYKDPKNASGRNGQSVSVTQNVEGIKPKDLIGIPWMFAFAMRDDGWYLREDIIWAKPNPMPESVRDRCTRSHEYIFLFSKSRKYYYNAEAIAERAKYDGRKDTRMKDSKKYANSGASQTISGKGHERWKWKDGVAIKNKRDVWTIPTKPFSGAHFATYPPDLIEPCILAGSPRGGVVLDPFCGSGTTIMVAEQNGRDGIGIELNRDYEPIIWERITKGGQMKMPM